jgi:hypothetical protein
MGRQDRISSKLFGTFAPEFSAGAKYNKFDSVPSGN